MKWWQFWKWHEILPETPEQANEVVEPKFNVLTNIIPGRYPRATILEAKIWAGRMNPEKGMLKILVEVNTDIRSEVPQTGYIYLNPMNYAMLLQAMGEDRTDNFQKLVGRRIAVESREVMYMARSGYELIIAGPKIVWGNKS